MSTESASSAMAGGTSSSRFQILALDGGGIRGLFSAAVLAAVEEDLGVTITDHFDLIAGTSTGGIIAIALGMGLRPKEIVDFYQRLGPTIFSNPGRWRSLLHWLASKYPAAPLEAALREILGTKTFGESAKRLVIPAYNIGEDDVYVFRTPHLPHLRRDLRVPSWQVALATSAAPTYFPVCHAVDHIRLIDGGVWANNPSMAALIEAVGPLGVPLAQVHLLSLGTYDAVEKRRRHLNSGGLLRWARPAVSVIMRATSIGVSNHVRFLLGKDRFYRVDPKVPAEDAAVLDDIASTTELVSRALHYSRLHMPEIARRFAGHLAAPYVPVV